MTPVPPPLPPWPPRAVCVRHTARWTSHQSTPQHPLPQRWRVLWVTLMFGQWKPCARHCKSCLLYNVCLFHAHYPIKSLLSLLPSCACHWTSFHIEVKYLACWEVIGQAFRRPCVLKIQALNLYAKPALQVLSAGHAILFFWVHIWSQNPFHHRLLPGEQSWYLKPTWPSLL